MMSELGVLGLFLEEYAKAKEELNGVDNMMSAILVTDNVSIHVYDGDKLVDIYTKETGVPKILVEEDGADRDGDSINIVISNQLDDADRDEGLITRHLLMREKNQEEDGLDNDQEQEKKRVEKIIRDDFSEFTDKELLDAKLLARDYSHKPNDNEARFKKITKEMLDLYSRKNTDYGGSFDESLDEDGLLVAKIKFRDKLNRFSQLIDNEALVYDESMRDTLIDLGNYAIMTLMWLDENEDFE